MFKTQYRHFKYLVMSFRLANALVIFELYIYNALRGLLDRICVVYLNNILIYLEDEKEHDKHIKEVLN
jgi:hypothetical protein